MLKKMAAILLCSAVAVSVTQAEPVSVDNPSFETLTGGGDQGGWTYEGDVANWSGLGAVADWLVPMANTTDTWYAGVGGVSQTLGYQELATEYVAGGEYTLQVAVGRRSDHDGLDVSSTHWGLALGYLDEEEGFQVLADVDGTIALNGGGGGTFVDQTLTYTTDAAGLGKNIAIGLINHADIVDGTYGGGFSQSCFDNVRLDVTVVPEPGTLALLLAGLFGACLIGRR